MLFGIIGRTGPGMRQVVRFGDQSTGRGTFGGEFGARHCNQWGLYGVCVRERRDAALFPNYFGQTCYMCCDARPKASCGQPWAADVKLHVGHSEYRIGRVRSLLDDIKVP